MREALSLPDGGRWLVIETNDDAMSAQSATETAIGHFFRSELRRRESGLKPMEYFVLSERDGSFPVCLRVGATKAETIVTGFRNSDPYPEHAKAIAALGDHLGRNLSGFYPYGPGPRYDSPAP